MSMHKLSAGAGYRYLLRHTCSADVDRDPATPLTAYYAASGYPPGQWMGTGLAGVGVGSLGEGQLVAGSVVTEEAMAALYGRGRDPVTGTPLGKAYPTYKTTAERVAARVAKLPTGLTNPERADAIGRIEQAEHQRRSPVAVAGFDLTFTLPKSASVLWALADEPTRQRIAAAHRAAVSDALAFVEDRALFTRTGVHSCAQVTTRGIVAAGFEHWDTRSADPNLHTHLVVANKVQGPDGRWRSVDSRALHHSAVAVSELYDNLVADHITRTVPVRWSWRPRGPRRTPAFEIDGIGDDLLAEFSTRSADIDTGMRRVVADFHATHGRGPSRVETLRLRQQVTRATRPAKTTHRLADLIATWKRRARHRTGREPHDITTDTLRAPMNRRSAAKSLRVDEITPSVVARLAAEVVEQVMTRRSTWTRWNILAETARATRGLRLASTADRLALHDRVADAAIARSVPLDTPDLFSVPAEYRRADGASVFTRAGEATFTDIRVLDAEARLLAATADTAAPTVQVDTARRVATSPVPVTRNAAPVRLAQDQVDAVVGIATSARRLDVLIGPAGTGKTTTLRALRAAWETSHGNGSVIGLAPSATAAAELAAALRIGCENTAKWLHETTGPAAQERAEILTILTGRRADAARRGDLPAVRRIDTAAAALVREQRRWQLAPGQLLIIDEASLAGTFTLDTLTSQATQAGAKVLLVGDHQQLTAVEAGGAFGLLAATGRASELTSLWRFRRRWEANTSRLLRHGDPAALDQYGEHRRIQQGPVEAMLDAAYTDWQTALQAGRSAILLAADIHTVDALNTRAHDDRVTAGLVAPTGVPAASEQTVCAGDRVVTRRNERQIQVPGHGHLRNGDLWTVTASHPDGSLTLSPASRHTTRKTTGGDDPVRIHLPASYVSEHLELGYATTTHRAQGITVEQTHVLAAPGMTRQGLYVAMTRGRSANHLYVATDAVHPTCDEIPDPGMQQTARDILTRILATDGTELSATQTMRQRQDQAASLATLVPIRATLLADADHRRWARLLPACGLDHRQTQQILGSPAAGALFAALRAGESDGHPMPRILRWLAAGRSLDDADDLAAVLHDRVTGWLDDNPDPPTYDNDDRPDAPDAAALAALLGAGHVNSDDPTHPTLAAIDALIRSRIKALTLGAAETRPEWTRPLGDQPPSEADRQRWRQCVALVCAHRDLTGATGHSTLGADPSRDDTDRQRRRITSHAAATAHRLGQPEPDRSLHP